MAHASDSPYTVIVNRNAFALQPIPPPLKPVVTPGVAATALDIKLTGVAAIFGQPWVLLEIINPLTKKTDRPPILHEGETYDNRVRIVAIDTAEGRVRIVNDGIETTLDFQTHGVKPNPVAVTAAPLPARLHPEQVKAYLERQRGSLPQPAPAMPLMP